MLNMLRTAALSAAIGVTALTGMAAAAQAEGLYLNFGGRGEPRAGVYVGEDGPRHVGAVGSPGARWPASAANARRDARSTRPRSSAFAAPVSSM